MAAFVPKGDKSLRVIVTEMAVRAAYDDVLTFDRLAVALGMDGRDDRDRDRIRQAVTSARPGLLKHHQRVLVSDRGTGYRVGRPGEFAGIADRLRQQGERKFSRALAVIENAPQADMTPAELTRHQAIGIVVRHLNDQVNNHEQLIADAYDRIAALEEAMYGPKPPVIQGTAEPATAPAADGDLGRLEDAMFRRGS